MRNLRYLLVIYGCFWAVVAGSAAAAEFIQQEQFIVPHDDVIQDDLYISASEVIIDGRIEGDVVAFGSYIEINGQVTGDLIVAAAGVAIYGEVGDDARLLTGSAVVSGRVGDDLVATGSGNAAAPVPFQAGGRTFDLGVFLQEGDIGGDVFLLAGLVELTGRIGGDLNGLINHLVLDEVTIDGGADLNLAGLTADETSRVGGENGFAYTAAQPLSVPSSLSENIVYSELVQEDGGITLFTLLRRIIGSIAGFALLGWLLLRYRPNWIFEPAAVLGLEPLKCLLVGFIVALSFLFVPVITVVLMIAVGFFWGLGIALAAGGFVLLALIMLWAFSPLLVGIWVGSRFSRQPFGALLTGAALITVLSQIPLLGLGISAAAFMAAAGALILARPLKPLPPQV